MADAYAADKYRRRVTPIERVFSWSPFSTVTIVARIKGNVTEEMVQKAVSQARARHPHLRARLETDANRDLWLTSDGARPNEIASVARQSEDHWMAVVQEAGQIPFDFDARPAFRFILVRSESVSELIILGHHMLCDGLSLAFLARDLLGHLGDPSQEAQPLHDPEPITLANLPESVRLNGVMRHLIRRINKKWEGQRVVFDQADYEALTRAYWANQRHHLGCIELSEAQTSGLVERCRAKRVTVNSALCAAFAGAQASLQHQAIQHPAIGVGVSLRNRLREPAGEVIGFFAGVARLRFMYSKRHTFWDNARRLHTKVQSRYANKRVFADHLTWLCLDPTILEAMNFKKLGAFVPPTASGDAKVSAFAAREDVVLSILKREKIESLERLHMGAAVTNLGSLGFPRCYGSLELDRLILRPGGAFPLANVGLLLGAVTCAGKLSLAIEYAPARTSPEAMAEIRTRAMRFLLG